MPNLLSHHALPAARRNRDSCREPRGRDTTVVSRRLVCLLVVCFVIGASPLGVAAQPMAIVAIVGCVDSDERGRFLVTQATAPTALQERLPEPPPPNSPLGNETIRLVGTLDEFGVSRLDGHKVWIKGLLNPGDPLDLLNLTSITDLSSSCE